MLDFEKISAEGLQNPFLETIDYMMNGSPSQNFTELTNIAIMTASKDWTAFRDKISQKPKGTLARVSIINTFLNLWTEMIRLKMISQDMDINTKDLEPAGYHLATKFIKSVLKDRSIMDCIPDQPTREFVTLIFLLFKEFLTKETSLIDQLTALPGRSKLKVIDPPCPDYEDILFFISKFCEEGGFKLAIELSKTCNSKLFQLTIVRAFEHHFWGATKLSLNRRSNLLSFWKSVYNAFIEDFTDMNEQIPLTYGFRIALTDLFMKSSICLKGKRLPRMIEDIPNNIADPIRQNKDRLVEYLLNLNQNIWEIISAEIIEHEIISYRSILALITGLLNITAKFQSAFDKRQKLAQLMSKDWSFSKCIRDIKAMTNFNDKKKRIAHTFTEVILRYVNHDPFRQNDGSIYNFFGFRDCVTSSGEPINGVGEL